MVVNRDHSLRLKSRTIFVETKIIHRLLSMSISELYVDGHIVQLILSRLRPKRGVGYIQFVLRFPQTWRQQPSSKCGNESLESLLFTSFGEAW